MTRRRILIVIGALIICSLPAAPLFMFKEGRGFQALRHRYDSYRVCNEFLRGGGSDITLRPWQLLGWGGGVYRDWLSQYSWEWTTVTERQGKRMFVSSLCSVMTAKMATGLSLRSDSTGEWALLEIVNSPVACDLQPDLCH